MQHIIQNKELVSSITQLISWSIFKLIAFINIKNYKSKCYAICANRIYFIKDDDTQLNETKSFN